MKKRFLFTAVLLAGMIHAQTVQDVQQNLTENAEKVETQQEVQQEVSFDSKQLMAGTVDSTDENGAPVKKHYFTAIAAMMLNNTLISSYNRFVTNSAWAKVTMDDALHFYEHEMSWDRDWYWTNFVLHPYQGSLYYMASRSSNLNQLESFAVTVLGSSIWEWFCETNEPSKNDMIYTTVGAFAVGEMLYRLSIEGSEISKLLGYAINPDSLFTTWVTGERPHGTTGNIHELSLKFSGGTARTYTTFEKYFDSNSEVFPAFISPEFNVVYNDPYGWDSNTPYSQFEFTMGAKVGFGSGEGESSYEEKLMYDIYITSNGMIFSRAPDFGENKDTTIGLVFDYDFIWHSFVELSSLAPGFAIKQRIRHAGGSKTEWQLHLDALLLGTTDYYYWRRESSLSPQFNSSPSGVACDYSYTYGAETVLKYKFTSKTGKIIDMDFHGYAMRVFKDQLQKGLDTGWELIGITSLNGEIPVTEKVNVGLGNQLYVKKTFYDFVPEIFQSMYTGSVFVRLKLK